MSYTFLKQFNMSRRRIMLRETDKKVNTTSISIYTVFPLKSLATLLT